MRTAGLLAFAILLPVFTYAATLVNINTADAALLDTLPGVGSVIAGRIIDYRTANGPFTTIKDIQKVSGIGSGSTYSKIEPLITVGDTSATSTSDTASSTQSTATSSSGEATAYAPPPSLSVSVSGARSALREVPLRLSARVTVKGGAIDPAAQITWSFGDGSSGEGNTVEKTYRYAGTYLIVATAIDGATAVRGEMIVTVTSAKARIHAISGEGVTIANDSSERLDLSFWRLTLDSGSFRIPDGMIILPDANVLLPFAVMNLPIAFNATLLYPSGGVAARYVPPMSATTPAATSASAPEQPSRVAASYREVQAVEPITSPKTDVPSHDEAVVAPAAATELAAAGAALPPPTLSVGASTSDIGAAPRASGIFKSPWTSLFLGVMILSAGAFILL